MLSTLYQKVKDVSVVRRFGFAATFLLGSMPANYLETMASFDVLHQQSRNNLMSQQVQTLIKKVNLIDSEAFATDQNLIKEIVDIIWFGTEALFWYLPERVAHCVDRC